MEPIQAITYPVHFKEKGYAYLSELIEKNNYSSIFILVDNNTIELCYPKFIQNLATKTKIEVIEIEAGEVNKNIETCVGVWNAMTELGADTDLGGFVASAFKRGVDFVNIPTTLLSMVDASVGGKTGVDLGVLKNQIGLFSNPELVIVDAEYLQTLSAREIRSGTAEIIKYGLTYVDITTLIRRSIEIKNEVVIEDPKEKGLRKILNYGHTIGHAIESYFLDTESKAW